VVADNDSNNDWNTLGLPELPERGLGGNVVVDGENCGGGGGSSGGGGGSSGGSSGGGGSSGSNDGGNNGGNNGGQNTHNTHNTQNSQNSQNSHASTEGENVGGLISAADAATFLAGHLDNMVQSSDILGGGGGGETFALDPSNDTFAALLALLAMCDRGRPESDVGDSVCWCFAGVLLVFCWCFAIAGVC
jgi:hypothetical protein